MNYRSLKEVQSALFSGKVSSVALVQDYLSKIKANTLNAFIETFDQSALDLAIEVDEKIASGKHGKLAGMVIGIKDNICYKGHKVSCSSKILEGFESIYSATVVERLLQEDAIIIGRLNCDEFAMGSSNETSYYGVVKNPIQPDKVPGGSSGGSAASVTAGLCLATLGSDTGGSIRQPASFCGNVGFKPTYGRVSRYGLIAFASSLDQIGPFANNVEDIAAIMQVMAGKDEHDSTSSSKQVENYTELLQQPLAKKRIAYIKECIEHEGVDAEIKAKIKALLEQLKAEGHTVEEVAFPYLDYMIPTYYVLSTAEASSNLSRYDGVHYGRRAKDAVGVEQTYTKSRTEGFGTEVKRRILLGTYVLSSGYYDAYYSKAQKIRRIITNYTNKLFAEYNFVVTPTSPQTAFGIGENINDPITMYLQDIFTVMANINGCPAISLPIGTHSNGLPYGVQFMAQRFKDADLLHFSNSVMHK
ncbi:MAG: Asp-tRNA(Asn)/Glu-tRNA(Gln) amidotransferase subunit GatA [Bacteroidia bacterium]